MKSTLILALAAAANAHTVGWAKGMYCLGGSDPSVDIPNQNDAVNPLYQFKQEDWWFQHERGCDKAPPKDGDILELPAGGQVTLEMAHNRAFTSLSYDGEMTTAWPDGKEHPEDWRGAGNPPECIQDDGALHTNNQSMAAGTALAISYESELSAVTMENLVVFSVLEQ